MRGVPGGDLRIGVRFIPKRHAVEIADVPERRVTELGGISDGQWLIGCDERRAVERDGGHEFAVEINAKAFRAGIRNADDLLPAVRLDRAAFAGNVVSVGLAMQQAGAAFVEREVIGVLLVRAPIQHEAIPY